jgi:hypothetical protein
MVPISAVAVTGPMPRTCSKWAYLPEVLSRLPTQRSSFIEDLLSHRCVQRYAMTLLTQAVVVRANIDVDRMSAQQKAIHALLVAF